MFEIAPPERPQQIVENSLFGHLSASIASPFSCHAPEGDGIWYVSADGPSIVRYAWQSFDHNSCSPRTDAVTYRR
jgi:hypothetical protein